MATGIKGGTYRISRVIGNNFVCTVDDGGKEVILRGLGIGFKKHTGDLVPMQQVEKIYDLRDPEQSSRLRELLADVPPEFFDVSTEIIEAAEARIGRRLSENIYITLTDHICFAVERLRSGVSYPNHLLWEITNFYPAEFAIGKQALDMIDARLGFCLPQDEAGFIALHIVNAEIDGKMADMVRITELIRKIISVVQDYYGVALDEQSLDYGRFITHLKFLGQRITQNRYAVDDDSEFQNMIVRRYRQDYRCAEQIRAQLRETFAIQLPSEEMTFLTIHLHRLALSMGITEQKE
nr:PRD domain-containing protein [uncultured Agathobaculum sp.]